jgi:hypothetical protein
MNRRPFSTPVAGLLVGVAIVGLLAGWPNRLGPVAAAPPAAQPVASPQARAVIDPALAAAVQGTVEAQATTIVNQTTTINAQATAIAEMQLGTPPSLTFERNDVEISVDAEGILAEDTQALEAVRQQLDQVTRPYRDRSGTCIGVVLTFAHRPGFNSANVEEGYRLAARINELLATEFPDLVAGAVFEAYGNLSPPDGRVELQLYLSHVTGANCPQPVATPIA